MSGKMSRNKGKRVEYLVRDELRAMGFHDAVRVPLSGASEGFKGDVVFTDKSLTRRTVEVKARKSAFSTIYKYYVNTALRHPELGVVTIWTKPEKGSPYVFTRDVSEFVYPSHAGLFKTLYKLKAGADLLVIKDNNKPLVWIEWDNDGDVAI